MEGVAAEEPFTMTLPLLLVAGGVATRGTAGCIEGLPFTGEGAATEEARALWLMAAAATATAAAAAGVEPEGGVTVGCCCCCCCCCCCAGRAELDTMVAEDFLLA